MQEIHAQNAVLAGETADLYFAHGRAVRKVVKGLTLARLAVEENPWGLVVAGGKERHAIQIRLPHQLGEAQDYVRSRARKGLPRFDNDVRGWHLEAPRGDGAQALA